MSTGNKMFSPVLVIVIILLVIMVGSCMGGGNSSSSSSSTSTSPSTKTCQVCDRKFSDDTNKNYIRWTNMCKNCYLNYCYAKGMTPTNYDK